MESLAELCRYQVPKLLVRQGLETMQPRTGELTLCEEAGGSKNKKSQNM